MDLMASPKSKIRRRSLSWSKSKQLQPLKEMTTSINLICKTKYNREIRVRHKIRIQCYLSKKKSLKRKGTPIRGNQERGGIKGKDSLKDLKISQKILQVALLAI